MGMVDESYPPRFRAVCDEVRGRGWRRVILLGDDLVEGPYTLRATLAQAGVMVFMPGPADRAWLQGLGEDAREDAGTRARLAALLADGMEHGVDGLVVADPLLGMLAEAALPGVVLLDVTEA